MTVSRHAAAVVRGTLRYAQDQELPGMLYGRILRSPYPNARIVRVDVAALPPGVAVLTPDDVRELGRYGCQIKDQTVLAIERARFVGDAVAAVAAETEEAAEEALASIDVEYEELPAVVGIDEALTGRTLVHERIQVSDNDAAYFGIRPEQGTNVCHRFRIVHGDAGAGFEDAEVVVEGEYRTAAAQHAPMEPHATLAAWDGDRLDVWTGTHTPFNVREDLAGVFGLPEEQIRIICPPMGGSFGAKTFVKLEAVTAALARRAGRPVRIVLPRSEEWVTNNRHPSLIRIRVGARRDGTLVAKQIESWIDTGAYADCGPGVAVKIGYSAVGPYRIPNVHVESRCVYTNLPPSGAYRGFGATQAVWASECLMDRLADRLGMDPFELRLRNLLRDGDTFCTGEQVHDVHFADCLERAAAAISWRENRHGKGLCVLLKGMQTPSRASIAIEADGDGTYTLRCATAEMGQGSRRALSLVAAELLGVTPEEVRFPDPDTSLVPYDTRATSSRSTYMMSRAIEEAVRDLRRNGTRGYGEVRNEGGLDPDTGQGLASSHWHQGAGAAEVSVDEETGKVEVVRLHAATYAGRVVNLPGAELQNEGSMIMGLGSALYEAVEFAEGQVTNANLSDYEIPSIADMPELSHELVQEAGAEVHGLGETAVPPIAAAIGNALGSLGIHVTELPITAERVLEATDRRDSGEAE